MPHQMRARGATDQFIARDGVDELRRLFEPRVLLMQFAELMGHKSFDSIRVYLDLSRIFKDELGQEWLSARSELTILLDKQSQFKAQLEAYEPAAKYAEALVRGDKKGVELVLAWVLQKHSELAGNEFVR